MVYLIDDDRSVRRAFELFFKSAGFDYRSFASANDFLKVFQQGLQDTLVLDLNLPGMSGCDLLTELDRQGIHLPVIVVTAFDDPTSRDKCRQYGVKAYLRKPVDGETLIDILQYNSGLLVTH